MNNWLIGLLLLLSQVGKGQHSVDFNREYIDFSIDSGRFVANGIYGFVNHQAHPAYQSIAFPFSPDAESVRVKRVFDLSHNRSLKYHCSEKAIAFDIHVNANDTTLINIVYSQKTQQKNTYILTSTKAWQKPLQQATYTLRYDPPVKIDSVSLKPDSIASKVYYWKKTTFLPQKEFSVWVDIQP